MHARPPLIAVGRTDRGRVRARNEDAFVVDAAAGLGVVTDGMGGHPGGDVASRIAARAAAEALRALMPNDTGRLREDTMRESVLRAHEAVRAHGRGEPALDGMGTTATVLALDPSWCRFALANVGDSRAYLQRDGTLVQLTRDDTWVQERVEAGRLTPEAAAGHPMGHLLTQCLGLEPPPVPRTRMGSVLAGDTFLLCSDGLLACLAPSDIESVLRSTLDETVAGAERTLTELVDSANRVGGFDNITVVLMTVPSEGRPGTFIRPRRAS